MSLDRTIDFLNWVRREQGRGYIFSLEGTKPKSNVFANNNSALAVIENCVANNEQVFVSLAEFRHDSSGRKAVFAERLKSVFIDLDCGEGKPYPNQAEALIALMSFCKAMYMPKPTVIVDSGGGIHAYWCFLDATEIAIWKPIAESLKSLCINGGLEIDRPVTADAARVMRVPGSFNLKLPNTPRLVNIIHPEKEKEPVFFSKEVLAGKIDHALRLLPKSDANSQVIAPCTMSTNLTLGTNLKAPPPPETPEEIERVRGMLTVIPANCKGALWRSIIWALAHTGWKCAKALAREWSLTDPSQFKEKKFNQNWDAFDPDREDGVKFGTLVHYAKEYGFQSTEDVSFTGNGVDVENGKLFAKIWRGKLLFVHETGDVLRFDAAAGWVSAPPGEADRAAKRVLKTMHAEASARYKAEPDDAKTSRLMAEVKRTSKAQNLRAMIDMAKSETGMTKSLNDFDTDPMQLGVGNGVLDLRSCTLLPVSADLMVTKRCNVDYDPEATCPLWMKFLDVVQPDPVVQDFLQRWFGYCLTGSVEEQKFVFLHGDGENGKTVFVESQAWLLGEYAKKIATEMLMHHQRSPQSASPDIVSLKGRRFVYANETEEGRKLAEARVKDMTGGDTLTGRVLYGNEITFQPTHKLAIVGNHKPEIGDSSNGMWRRPCLVQFGVTIDKSKRDPKLPEKLKAEGAGILNWVLAGMQKWQLSGLSIPQQIIAATTAYHDEQDIIGDWLNDHCNTGPSLTERKDSLYRAYRKWALDNGHHPLAQTRLTRRLGGRGFHVLSDKRTVGGLSLNQQGMVASMAPK